MEDNNVYVNIKINTDGVKFGTKEVSDAVVRASQNMAKYGKAVQIACDKAANAFLRQNQAVANTSAEVDRLTAELEKAKNTKTKTSFLTDEEEALKTLESEYSKLEDKKLSMEMAGKNETQKYYETIDLMRDINREIERQKNLLSSLQNDPRSYTNADTSAIEEKLSAAKQKHANAVNNASIAYEKFYETTRKSTNILPLLKQTINGLQRAFRKVESVIKNLVGSFKKLVLTQRKASNSNNGINMSFKKGLTTILKYGFGIRSLYIAWRKLRSAMIDGFKTLAQENEGLNKSISGVMTQLNSLKNSFAAAFSPIVQLIAPKIEQIVAYINKLMRSLSMLIAALSGNNTFTVAKEVQQDYAKSLDNTAKSADKAKKYLSSLDEIKQFTTDESNGGGVQDAFEELPVNSWAKSLSDKLKDIFSKLFDPLKEAWNRVGQKVIDAWKYALENVRSLIKKIGEDFLKVWNQEETIKIFENVLLILADIGLIIGNLAKNFEEAWSKNDIGLKILESIRDIIGIIVQGFKDMADATVEWSEKLDFYPFLESLQKWLESTKPIMESLKTIVSSFYTDVILPLSKWTLEKGLPELLDIMTKFNEKVDWEKITNAIKEFWKHLEPFAETVGEGLIIFIGKLSDKLADFLNSDTFINFLKDIEKWMDDVTAEDIASTLGTIADLIPKIVIAFAGFKALTMVSGIITGIAGSITTLSNALSVFSSVIEGSKTLYAAANIGLGLMSAGVTGLTNETFKFMKNQKDTNDVLDKYGISLKMSGEKQTELQDGYEVTNTKLKAAREEIKENEKQNNLLYKAYEKIKGHLEKNKTSVEQLTTSTLNSTNEIKNQKDEIERTTVKMKENKASSNELDLNIKTLTKTNESATKSFKDMSTQSNDSFTQMNKDSESVFNSMSNAWSNMWAKMEITARNNINMIISEINSLINGINRIDISTSISNIKTSSYNGMPSNIPHLATGAVIPPNAPFLATLGDQRSGTNFEAPEGLLRQVVREESGSGSYQFTAQLNRRVLFDEFINEAKLRQSASGRNPFEFA